MLKSSSEISNPPLLHTVVFESIESPERPIKMEGSLIAAIQALHKIEGVSAVNAAHISLNTPNIIEELLLEDADALQVMRTHPIHDKVIEVARSYTNWKVIDRPVPDVYYDEPYKIAAARNEGFEPILHNRAISFKHSTQTSEVASVLEDAKNALDNATNSLMFSPEVALSLDRRKGDVAIIRIGWLAIDELNLFKKSREWGSVVADLRDISNSMEVTYKP